MDKTSIKGKSKCEAGKSIKSNASASSQIVKYTTHLPPATVKAIKLYAVQNDKKDYQVVKEAVEKYLNKQSSKQG